MPAFMIEAPEFRGQPSVPNFSDGLVGRPTKPCEQQQPECSRRPAVASAYTRREILHLWQCSKAQIFSDLV